MVAVLYVVGIYVNTWLPLERKTKMDPCIHTYITYVHEYIKSSRFKTRKSSQFSKIAKNQVDSKTKIKSIFILKIAIESV